MGRTAPPTATQLQTALQADGVLGIPLTTRQALLDLQGAVDAALEEFLSHTGLVPLLPETVDSVRRYDPPGPTYRNKYWTVGGDRLLLTLKPPYQEITEIKIFDDPAVADDGQVLEADQDYVLEPANRIEETRINAIRFRFAVVGGRQSVVITGKVGWWPEFIPEDIWQAILAGAKARILEDLRAGIASNPQEWKEGDSSEAYRVETLRDLAAAHRSRFEEAIATERPIIL